MVDKFILRFEICGQHSVGLSYAREWNYGTFSDRADAWRALDSALTMGKLLSPEKPDKGLAIASPDGASHYHAFKAHLVLASSSMIVRSRKLG